MKTQTNPHDQVQRLSSPKRKLPLLLLALAAALLAAGSAQATIIINVTQVGSDVVFSLSGSFNTASAIDSGIVTPAPGPGQIDPNFSIFKFSTSGAKDSVIHWVLPNVSGPSAFGSGVFDQADSGASNSNLEFVPFIKGQTTLNLYTSYVSGTSLSDTMTFSGQSFASLGVTPGTYTWSWAIEGQTDSLILEFGVPDTGSTLMLMGLGLVCLGLLRPKNVA